MKKLIAAALFAAASPATANQWVMGDVAGVWEYNAYNSTLGILVTLGNAAWGGGSSTNGPTACTARFRMAVGYQGVTEATMNRMWSAILTAQSTGKKAQFYVDTDNGVYCAVQIVVLGQPLQ